MAEHLQHSMRQSLQLSLSDMETVIEKSFVKRICDYPWTKVPIVGRVCMDQMMVDATSIPDIQRNDVVTLIGKDGNEEITVEEISALAGTFNYEFVCDLNKRIPRNYYYNGRYIGSHDYFHEKWNLEI